MAAFIFGHVANLPNLLPISGSLTLLNNKVMNPSVKVRVSSAVEVSHCPVAFVMLG